MHWDTNDYPSSLKYLDVEVRKKAIEIANAMVDEGYEEGTAIPIATDQAKEWYENASKKEKNQIKNKSDKDLRTRDSNKTNSRPELQDKEELVIKREDGWAVQAEDAKRASDVFDKKEDAINRAKEIAENKGTDVNVKD
ncbi:uncharacterized protein YdaT [Gracilibacillus halotolerans]|uniref:Uncharacterized protein YdaT n=1 Tax=Gracilibacillus halotolerans TaxID=74386 RepID=A0A841RM54_9BACI|nr:uncharacterized protein YdaT [Gracilibacillus halotolerans]